jgi:hypothetical protein
MAVRQVRPNDSHRALLGLVACNSRFGSERRARASRVREASRVE